MDYTIDPRKNWALAEVELAKEGDPRRRQVLETLIAHAKAEAAPDFEALMATVSPRAHYHNYSDASDPAHSPKGKDGVEAYYKMIVETGLGQIEHAIERISVGRDVITTEGELKMGYPGSILQLMEIRVPDPGALYLYRTRLLIVWGFDADGLVLCEDSYDGGGPKFEGIAERKIAPEEIYSVVSVGA